MSVLPGEDLKEQVVEDEAILSQTRSRDVPVVRERVLQARQEERRAALAAEATAREAEERELAEERARDEMRQRRREERRRAAAWQESGRLRRNRDEQFHEDVQAQVRRRRDHATESELGSDERSEDIHINLVSSDEG